MSTELGGEVFVPMAVRNRLSTMMMRVNPVIISSMAGRKESMVSRTSVSILKDQVWLPSGPGVAVKAGTAACASAKLGKASSTASIRPGKNRRFIMSSAPLQCAGEGRGKARRVTGALSGCEVRIFRRGGRQGVQQRNLLAGHANHQARVFDFHNGDGGPGSQASRGEHTQRLLAAATNQAATTYCPCACQYHHKDEY